MVYSATSAAAALGEATRLLPEAPGRLRARRRRAARRSRAVRLPRLRHARAAARPDGARPLRRVLVVAPQVNGARRWLTARPAHVPAVRAREARAAASGPPRTSRARRRRGRSASCWKPVGLVDVPLLRADPARARPRHGDRAAADGRRDARRRRRARPRLLGAAGTIATARRPRRDLVRAVPARAHLQLPRPLERPAGRRLPDRAGDDRARLGRHLRQGPRRGRAEDLLPPRGADGHDLRGHRRGARADRHDGRDRRVRRLRVGRASRSRCAAAIRSASCSPPGSRRSSAARRPSTSPPCSGSRR